MTTCINEPARSIPVDSTCDVMVVGGGVAGVSAALAAARTGVRVILIERMFGLGGLATLGNVVKYLPLCDGRGTQVIGGISEELLHLSAQDIHHFDPGAGITPVPSCWDIDGDLEERKKKRMFSSFNPASFQLYMEDLLCREGISIMYDTRLCNVVTHNKSISHLIVENKSGRLAIAAHSVVDASGDADVCALAGCQTENFPNNVLAGWHYLIKNGRVVLRAMSNRYDKEHGRGGKSVAPYFDGVNHRELTQHVLQSRAMLLDTLHELRKEEPDGAIYPTNLATIPDVRMTRRLKNSYAMNESIMHTQIDDCIGLTGDWRRRGPIYPISMQTIQADGYSNLYAAGRCISADKTVCDVTRAIQTCAVTGEAGGVAAALQVKQGNHDLVPLRQLQGHLHQKGAILDQGLMTIPKQAV